MRTIGQTFTLYNVAGLIDKENNIYYVPHRDLLYSKRGLLPDLKRVCYCYNTLFNEVCPPSSTYQNIQISQWSPEDRKLVVQGTIDDFRVSRGRGLALNYLIVTRTVTDESESGLFIDYTYYYSFFIDSVRQAGANSVELNLTPDYFTDFFYLNNRDTCTIDYDPFNPVMRNAYVERQHYDRVREEGNGLVYANQEKILSTKEVYTYKYQYKDKRILYPLFNESEINFQDYYSLINEIKGVNSFNDFKTILSEKTEEERKLIINQFISYLNVQYKEGIQLPVYISPVEDYDSETRFYMYSTGYHKISDDGNITSSFPMNVRPFIKIPYNLNMINKSWFKIKYVCYIGEHQKTFNIDNNQVEKFISEVNTYGASEYILRMFISKYSPVSRHLSSIILNNNDITLVYRCYLDLDNSRLSYSDEREWEQKYPYVNSSHLLLGMPLCYDKDPLNHSNKFLIPKPIVNSPYITTTSDYFDFDDTVHCMDIGVTPVHAFDFELNDNDFSLVIDSMDMHDINLTLNDEIPEDLNRYFEPILESDPYSFYSLSYLETESILSKLRYFRSLEDNKYSVLLNNIISYNANYKIGVIFNYTYDNQQKYYTESLVYSVDLDLPLRVDSWFQFYIQNKGAMTVQRINNKMRYATDMQTIGLSFPSDLIGGIAKAQGSLSTGSLTTGSKTVSNIISKTLDYEYNDFAIKKSQDAKLSDIGNRPDIIKESGNDSIYEYINNDIGIHFNHYKIDDYSYNSISKYLERFGYQINLYDSINIFNRIGFNYVKLVSFDFVEDNIKLSSEQSSAIMSIFRDGVTLLHDKDYLHNLGEDGYHNVEIFLHEGGDN